MAEINETVETHNSGPGALLLAARKKLRLSQVTISERLNLTVEIIKQLESDQYKGDIPDAFIRGYLRTYARSVEQDEEQIIALYFQAIGTSIVSNHYIPSENVPTVSARKRKNLLMFGLPGIIILIFIIVYNWVVYSDTDSDSDSVTIESVEKSKVEKTNVIEGDPGQLNEPSVANDDVETETKRDNIQQSDKLSEPVEVPSGFVESPVLTDAELEFTFIDNCWIQVIDSNNEVLAVGVKASGRRFVVRGVPPLQIVLGKPRAVNIQFNNEMVDLSIYPASQTARFSLGEAIVE